MKSYKIHFIRHGITEANQKGIYAGSTDFPVSSDGKLRLKELSENYDYPLPNIIYTSPLKRCIQTCEIIYPESNPIIVDDLSECCFGDWEGKSAKELEKNEDFIKWLESGQRIAPPNGESGEQFTIRVCSVFDKIVENMMRSGITDASIITHGGVIMTILSAFGLPKAGFYDWIVDNGCGYSVRIMPSLWMRDKVVEVYANVPVGSSQQISGDFKYMIDVAREAGKRAYDQNK